MPVDTRPAKKKTLKFCLKLDDTVRMFLSVFVLVCFALTTQLLTFRQTAGLVNVRSDAVTLIVRKMAELKNILPPGTVVGYLSNIDKAQIGTGWVVRPKAFYLTQYALAPIIVDYSTEHSLVVGYFDPPLRFEADGKGLSLIRNFGNGIVLFRRKME
jgi:hypothetical protein